MAGESMSGGAWMSDVFSPAGLGYKQGSRTKYFGMGWNPAEFDLPPPPPHVLEALRRYKQGYCLERTDFPEAEAVWDDKRFSLRRDLFFVGPFFAVQGRLAEVLARFDLGEGGLIPFPVYQADLATPYPGEFFLLNFGCTKNTILIDRCEDARKFVVDKASGLQIWHINRSKPDGQVVLSPRALEGPDLWFEEAVHNKLFLSDALGQALLDIGMGELFRLTRCRIA